MNRVKLLMGIVCVASGLTYGAVDFTQVTTGIPQVDNGTVERFTACMESETVPFTIDIWLPEGYDASCSYPVVYMADGQNLFDKSLSFSGVAWEVEDKITQLAGSGKIPRPAIVVGICNRGAYNLREEDYFPEKALENIPADEWSRTYLPKNFCKDCRGDEYASFVARDVKRFVDDRYSTLQEREHTFTMGSSMGGLISLYIMCEYPAIVGGAACISTHWIGSISANASNGYTMYDDPVCADAILKYFSENLPEPGSHILYLDEGDSDWDALYVKYNKEMTAIAEERGYSQSAGTLMVKYWINSGHSEWFWQQHCATPLEFLLSSKFSGIENIRTTQSALQYNCPTIIYTLQGIPVGCDSTLLAPGIYWRKNRMFLKM